MPVLQKKISHKLSLKSRQKIFTDLDQMYTLALEAQNYGVALKALELRGRELGLFTDKKKDFSLPSLKEMTTVQLKYLLEGEKQANM